AASRAALKAAVERAKLDLQYTKVAAPISGRVSRYVVTVGNLVQAGDQGGGTLLTTIVSVDPMYAYFDVDEHTALRVRQLVRERALDTDQGQKVLYAVNEKNEVVSRPVRLGALHDGLREIIDGLKPGEPVIVHGLQQVRPGVPVEPRSVDMPVPLAANTRK